MLPEERSDPNHYIFDKNLDNCLYQGDVLQESLSPGFAELVNKYYSHHDRQFQCNYFLVLTQSCDLIRRGNEPPAAEYIGIAPIFPVKKVILKKAQEKQEWWQIDTRVIDHKHFESLALFVGKLLNNNISNYFYIHEDISQNISGFSCAILSLSMVFHIEYYDICLKAKTAQIQDIYRAKLGWNIGNIYSKVGTEEWDIFYPQKKVSTVASSLLKDVFININKEQIEKGKKKLTEHKKLSQYTSEEIFENIKNTKIIPKIKQFTDRTNTLLKDLDLISPICSRLLEEITMDKTFKQDLEDLLKSDVKRTDDQLPDKTIKLFTEKVLNMVKEKIKFIEDQKQAEDQKQTPPLIKTEQKIIGTINSTLKSDTVIKSLLK